MDKIDKMLIRIIKNNGLDNYINESRKQGIPTPDGYGYDIFNFMNKFHYSIEQICQIWRDRGNLMWAGEMPVFNQKGKPIWTTQNIDLFEPIEEDTDADEGKSWPKSTYTSDQDLKVVYFTII